jgi:hypothetical protein
MKEDDFVTLVKLPISKVIDVATNLNLGVKGRVHSAKGNIRKTGKVIVVA